jgi:tetratricopeptide (TPR) repeat protein
MAHTEKTEDVMTNAKTINSKICKIDFNTGTGKSAYAWRGRNAAQGCTIILVCFLSTASALALDSEALQKRCTGAEMYPAQAISACTSLIETKQVSERALAATYINRAVAFAKQSEQARALADLTEALKMAPRSERGYLVRGMLTVAQGAPADAIADLDHAIEINPLYAPAYNGRASAFNATGKFDRAIADANAAIRINPAFAPAYATRGEAHARKGDSSRAIADYNRALQLNPQQTSALANRGLFHQSRGDIAIMGPPSANLHNSGPSITPHYAKPTSDSAT